MVFLVYVKYMQNAFSCLSIVSLIFVIFMPQQAVSTIFVQPLDTKYCSKLAGFVALASGLTYS